MIYHPDLSAIKYIGENGYKFDRIGRPYLDCTNGDIFIVSRRYADIAAKKYNNLFEKCEINDSAKEAPAEDEVVNEDMTKEEIEEAGKEAGIDLDKRKSKANMIADLQAHIDGN